MTASKSVKLNPPPKLNQFVLDIEFLLISVIQGVALAALATASVEPITHFQFEYFLYIISGFVFILIFWSQAIIHALSFIDWPINLWHSFLYFLASFVEVLVFSQINSPLGWFSLVSAFFVISFGLYLVDLKLIKAHQTQMSQTNIGKKFFSHIVQGQVFELKYFLPAGLIYNLACVYLIYYQPEIFLENHYHLILIGIQTLFGLIFLLNSTISFNQRSNLIYRYLQQIKS